MPMLGSFLHLFEKLIKLRKALKKFTNLKKVSVDIS